MASTSLDSLFQPKSIAVIGASDKPNRIGFQVMRSLQLGKYPGLIYPINPRLKTVLGLTAYPSVDVVHGDIDLAIIVLRKERVLEAIDASGRKGVKSLIVMSSGFSELGDNAAEGELINKTVTDSPVRWRDGFSFRKLNGKKIQLRFELKKLKLYSF